jgi:hypothetical protein
MSLAHILMKTNQKNERTRNKERKIIIATMVQRIHGLFLKVTKVYISKIQNVIIGCQFIGIYGDLGNVNIEMEGQLCIGEGTMVHCSLWVQFSYK